MIFLLLFASETVGKLSELKTRKSTLFFTLLIKLRFQGYSCESDIPPLEGHLE